MGEDERRTFTTEFSKVQYVIIFALLTVNRFGIGKFRSQWQSSDNSIGISTLFVETITNTKKLYCFLTEGFQMSNACHAYTVERAPLATSLI